MMEIEDEVAQNFMQKDRTKEDHSMCLQVKLGALWTLSSFLALGSFLMA